MNSWTRRVPHWIYVVLLRVKRLNSLVLNEKLDEYRSYQANDELVRWEMKMKDVIEKKTFKDRSKADFDRYLLEEEKYNISLS